MNKSGSILGHICIQIGDFSFPSRAWDDFPVVIMGWWLERIASLRTGTETRHECLFMDGPYYFVITAQDKEHCVLQFFRRGWKGRDERLLEAQCETKLIAAEMLSAAKLVIKTCREKTWRSSDLDILEAHYARLSKIVENKSN